MNSAFEKNWQAVGRQEGQGVTELEIADRRFLLIQLPDDVLLVAARCGVCSRLRDASACAGGVVTCKQCGARQPFPLPDSEERYPVMVVDDEIYVLPEMETI